MVIVSSNANLSAVSYTAGEIVDIVGAVLTINSTPTTRPGTIRSIRSGECYVENPSTTTPIVVELQDMNRDFQFEGNGILRVRGQMITIGTGNGSAQSWDFSTLFGGILTDITYIEAEQTPGSGQYMPWYIVEISPRYYFTGRFLSRGSSTVEYCGEIPVFFWNSDTRVLSCGDNTNGLAVPAGCAIRIPNILLTNQDWQPDSSLTHLLTSTTETGETATTGGNFTITVTNGRTGAVIGTTAAIARTATSAQVRSALELIVGTGNVTTSGGTLPTPVNINCAGTLANTPLRLLVNSSTTPAGSAFYTVEQTVSGMTLLDLSASGTLDAECCMFSRKIRVANTSFSSIRMVRVGLGGDGIIFEASNGSIVLDHVSSVCSPYVTSIQPRIANIFGTSSINKLISSTPRAQQGLAVSSMPKLSRLDDLRSLTYGTRQSTAAAAMTIQSIPAGLIVNRPHAIGGRMVFQNIFNNLIVSPRFSDHPGLSQLTTTPVSCTQLNNAIDVTIVDWGKIGIAACRAFMIITNSESANILMLGGSYDGSNNAAGINPGGSTLEIRNLLTSNLRSGQGLIDLPTSYAAAALILKKLFAVSSVPLFVDSCQDGLYDLAACPPENFTEANSAVENWVGGNFADYGSAPTTGNLTFGAFGRGLGLEQFGTTYSDQVGSIFLPAVGDSFIATIPYPVHAITSFTGSFLLIAESIGGISNQWRIINEEGISGGTFTLTIRNSVGTVLGTTGNLAWNILTTGLDSAVEAILGAGTVTVTGTLATGFLITTTGQLITIEANGAALTGGTLPGVAYSLGRHNVGLATGVALTAGVTVAGMTIEFSIRAAGGSWSAWLPVEATNLQNSIAGLTGYSAGGAGLEARIRVTATGTNDPYRRIQQLSLLTNINPALWVLTDSTIVLNGPSSTDVTRMVRLSDNSVLYSFTGSGTKEFELGSNLGVEVYFRREDAGGTVLMRTLPSTIVLRFGNNGSINLFYGDQIQLAQSAQVSEIKALIDARLDAAITTRLPTSAYTTPPTTTAIATAVEAQLSDEFAAIGSGGGGGGASAADIWNYSTRSLTDKAGFSLSSTAEDSIVTKVWAATGRTLTSFGTLIADTVTAVWGAATRSLTDKAGFAPTAGDVATAVDAALADNFAAIPTPPSTSAIATAVWASADKTGYSLTPAERTAIATAVEAALINEGDGQQLIDAIVQVINANLDLPLLELTAIAQAVRSELATELGRIDTTISSRLASAGYTAPPSTSAIATAVWAAVDKTGYSLTTAERTAIATAVDAALSDNFAAIPAAPPAGTIASAVRAELSTELGRIDTTIGSRSQFDPTTTPVTVGAINANVINAASIAADAVTEIQAGLATSAQVSGLNNLSTGQVRSEVDAALTAYDPPTAAELTALINALPSAVDAQLADNFTAVLSAISALPAPNNTAIAAILAKVDQITVTGGLVEATIGSQTVTLNSSQSEQLLKLYQLAGWDAANPADRAQNYHQVAGVRVNYSEPSPGVIRLTRVP